MSERAASEGGNKKQKNIQPFNLASVFSPNYPLLNPLFFSFFLGPQLFSELCVDSICTYVEMKNDIDVLGAIGKVDHPIFLISWASTLLFSSAFALNAFKTVPNFVFCSSHNPCDCNPNAFRLYQPMCEAIVSGSNFTQVSDSSSTNLGELVVVGGNMTTVIIGALVVFVMVAIICTSLTWIQRRKEKKVFGEMQMALQAKELTPEQVKLVANVMSDLDDSKRRTFGKSGEINPKGKKTGIEERRGSVGTVAIARLRIKYEDIKMVKANIGRGAFGDVHKATWNGVEVAIKQLANVYIETMRSFRAEILLMSQVSE